MRSRVSMSNSDTIQKISVIVPKSPFVPSTLQSVQHCLAALDVAKLIEWWPGQPHSPHRSAEKVQAIQRSLDWKRVAQIAAYLLQEEIVDVPGKKSMNSFEISMNLKNWNPGATGRRKSRGSLVLKEASILHFQMSSFM